MRAPILLPHVILDLYVITRSYIELCLPPWSTNYILYQEDAVQAIVDVGESLVSHRLKWDVCTGMWILVASGDYN